MNHISQDELSVAANCEQALHAIMDRIRLTLDAGATIETGPLTIDTSALSGMRRVVVPVDPAAVIEKILSPMRKSIAPEGGMRRSANMESRRIYMQNWYLLRDWINYNHAIAKAASLRGSWDFVRLWGTRVRHLYHLARLRQAAAISPFAPKLARKSAASSMAALRSYVAQGAQGRFVEAVGVLPH